MPSAVSITTSLLLSRPVTYALTLELLRLLTRESRRVGLVLPTRAALAEGAEGTDSLLGGNIVGEGARAVLVGSVGEGELVIRGGELLVLLGGGGSASDGSIVEVGGGAMIVVQRGKGVLAVVGAAEQKLVGVGSGKCVLFVPWSNGPSPLNGPTGPDCRGSMDFPFRASVAITELLSRSSLGTGAVVPECADNNAQDNRQGKEYFVATISDTQFC